MITYFGSKSKIGKWIVEYYPTDMETYVEPFSGSMGCFFNMDLDKFPNLKTVVYNDFNQLNSNLYKCIKEHDKFYEELIKCPCQEFNNPVTDPKYREMFKTFQKEVFNPNLILGDKPNFEIGVKYSYVLSQTFSSISPEKGYFVDLKGKYRSKFLSFIDKFKKEKYLNHIDKITFVENEDFEKVIKKYDSEKTYFYLDPPYKKREKLYSKHNFTTDTHERLEKVIKNVKGKWSLSYYDFPDLHKWYPEKEFRWEEKEYHKICGISTSRKDINTELLIMNY